MKWGSIIGIAWILSTSENLKERKNTCMEYGIWNMEYNLSSNQCLSSCCRSPILFFFLFQSTTHSPTTIPTYSISSQTFFSVSYSSIHACFLLHHHSLLLLLLLLLAMYFIFLISLKTKYKWVLRLIIIFYFKLIKLYISLKLTLQILTIICHHIQKIITKNKK